MRRIFLISGLTATWIVIVVTFFIIEEKLRTPPVHRGDVISLENYIHRRLNEALTEKKLGSAAIAIILNGNLVSEQGFGIANAETSSPVKTNESLYLLSSLSKAVTAWGVLKLVEQNKLGLDEPVLPYLKRWKFPGSEKYRDKVTVRHLLSHTAGFVDGYGQGGILPGETLQSIEESLNYPIGANMGNPHAAVVEFEPGTSVAYSTAGYGVLQLLIEEITGNSFRAYMKEVVLIPLGMTKSDYDVDSIIVNGRKSNLATNYDLDLKGHPHRRYANKAGVSLMSTVHDLGLFATAYFNDNDVLTKESIKQFSTPQPGTDARWSLGHTIYGKNNAGGYLIGHGGGAFPASGAEMRLNPESGNGFVILASGTQGLISDLADVWSYWETGEKIFDIRNVVRNRAIHSLVAIVIGIAVILISTASSRTSGPLKTVLPKLKNPFH